MIGEAQGECDDRQRRIRGTGGRENGTSGNIKISDTVDPTIGIYYPRLGSALIRVVPI